MYNKNKYCYTVYPNGYKNPGPAKGPGFMRFAVGAISLQSNDSA